VESTKADEIALALEEAIVSGEVEPGSILRQEQLSERYAVSRTPVREALRRLAALGLVQFLPNRGVRVRTLSREELREAFLVRAELESLATALAVPRFEAEGLAELEEAERRFGELTADLRAQAGDRREGHGGIVAEWMHANHAFHDVIYARANAPYVVRLAKSARRTFLGQTIWAVGSELDELYEKNAREHSAIRAAIEAGSVEGARELARDHVLASHHLLEVILDQVERASRSTAA
jgi:DNA-binding GntR family transcriptional regulator